MKNAIIRFVCLLSLPPLLTAETVVSSLSSQWIKDAIRERMEFDFKNFYPFDRTTGAMINPDLSWPSTDFSSNRTPAIGRIFMARFTSDREAEKMTDLLISRVPAIFAIPHDPSPTDFMRLFTRHRVVARDSDVVFSLEFRENLEPNVLVAMVRDTAEIVRKARAELEREAPGKAAQGSGSKADSAQTQVTPASQPPTPSNPRPATATNAAKPRPLTENAIQSLSTWLWGAGAALLLLVALWWLRGRRKHDS